MKVMLVVEPIPRGDDDVALDSLGSRGSRMGELALRDAVGPIREVGKGSGAYLFDELVEHLFTGLPRLDAAEPRFFGSGKLAERVRYLPRERARGKLAQLMAPEPTVVLHRIEPFGLRYVGRNCSLAVELARVRYLHHGIPINRRIVFRRRRFVRRHHRLE